MLDGTEKYVCTQIKNSDTSFYPVCDDDVLIDIQVSRSRSLELSNSRKTQQKKTDYTVEMQRVLGNIADLVRVVTCHIHDQNLKIVELHEENRLSEKKLSEVNDFVQNKNLQLINAGTSLDEI